MRDHYFINELGQKTAVSEMGIDLVKELLAEPDYEIIDDNVTAEDIKRRLEIELIIRSCSL